MISLQTLKPYMLDASPFGELYKEYMDQRAARAEAADACGESLPGRLAHCGIPALAKDLGVGLGRRVQGLVF